MAKSTDRRLLAMTLTHSVVCRFAQSKVWIDYFVCQSYAVNYHLIARDLNSRDGIVDGIVWIDLLRAF